MGRVICAGSINMDIVATAERHPNPGETVPGLGLAYFPGGKGANQAVAAARMAAETHMVGRVGDDSSGPELKSFLSQQGVDTSCVRTEAGAPTGTALIVVAQSENTIVVVPGANGEVLPSDVAVPMNSDDVLVSQFEIAVDTVTAFFQRGHEVKARTILNPAPARSIPPDLLSVCDVIVVNETELGYLVGAASVDTSNAAELASGFRSDGQSIIVTLGADGVILVDDSGTTAIKGYKVQAVDTTGAGDCFVGALAAGLSKGKSVQDAVRLANLAASLSVQRPGAGPSMPTAEEVRIADNG